MGAEEGHSPAFAGRQELASVRPCAEGALLCQGFYSPASRPFARLAHWANHLRSVPFWLQKVTKEKSPSNLTRGNYADFYKKIIVPVRCAGWETQLPNLLTSQLPYFQTLHSIALVSNFSFPNHEPTPALGSRFIVTPGCTRGYSRLDPFGVGIPKERLLNSNYFQSLLVIPWPLIQAVF